MSYGIRAWCSHCGHPLGGKLFQSKNELDEYIIKTFRCPNSNCNAPFSFGDNGRIWNVGFEEEPSKLEYALKVIGEALPSTSQYIFCYEDKGPKAKIEYRYPKLKLMFRQFDRTERATRAYCMQLLMPDSGDIVASYCFDSPDALFQLAQEALKGWKWLRGL